MRGNSHVRFGGRPCGKGPTRAPRCAAHPTQAGKGQVGLDQHQVRRWNSWHRFTTLALAALAILAICAAEAAPAEQTERPDMISLTVNEIRRLINVFRDQPAPSTSHRLHWSGWRRRHQARAKRAHYTHRLSLEFQP